MRYRSLALALAIAALVLAAAVDAKARDKKEEKKLTSPPSKPRTHAKPPPAAKATPKEVKAPTSSLPDLTTVSKPGTPKQKQHTVVSYGPTPAKPKPAARKAPARKNAAKANTPMMVQGQPKAHTKKGTGIPTVYRGKDGKLQQGRPKVDKRPTDPMRASKPAAVRKQEEKAANHFKKIQTVHNIINNPTKHRGVTINTSKGAPHPLTHSKRVRTETAKAKAANAAANAQAKHDGRKRPAAMTASIKAEEQRKADMKRAAKELKRTKQAAAEAAHAKTQDMKKAAQEHLRQKQAVEDQKKKAN